MADRIKEEEVALALAFGRNRHGIDRRCGRAFTGLLA